MFSEVPADLLLYYLLTIAGAILGYVITFGRLITIVSWTTVGYIISIDSGTLLVDVFNRFWQNSFRAIFITLHGGVSDDVALQPFITPGIQIPLFFRVMTFAILVFLGFFYSSKTTFSTSSRSPRVTGTVVGVYCGILWASMAYISLRQYQGNSNGLPPDAILPVSLFLQHFTELLTRLLSGENITVINRVSEIASLLLITVLIPCGAIFYFLNARQENNDKHAVLQLSYKQKRRRHPREIYNLKANRMRRKFYKDVRLTYRKGKDNEVKK